MKSIALFLVTVFSMSLAFAQSECEPYIPTKEGSKWEVTNYNAKGKADGTAKFELIEKTVSGSDMTFKVKSQHFDKKEDESMDFEYEAKCIDGKFQLDMSFMMDGNAFQSFQNMDFEIDATELKLPTMEEAVGTELDDGSMTLKLTGDSPINMNMTIYVTDRKIEGKEQLTTPAGTFDCIILTQKISTKMIMKTESTSKEWFAPEVGMVRSESYNKKGKLMGFSELTKLEK